MDNFEFKRIISDDTEIIILSGKLNEDSKLDELQVDLNKTIIFDLAQLQSTNSTGIRNWIRWHKEKPNMKCIFTHCPLFWINQTNTVTDFIPRSASIQSFFVPYYSEKTGEEKMVLVDRVAGLERQDYSSLPVVHDKLGNPMTIDTLLDRYLKFLRIY